MHFQSTDSGQLFGPITEKAEAFADGSDDRLAAVCLAKILAERGVEYHWIGDHFQIGYWTVLPVGSEIPSSNYATAFFRRERNLAVFDRVKAFPESTGELSAVEWLRAFPECWDRRKE
jgi:hypothetical protein